MSGRRPKDDVEPAISFALNFLRRLRRQWRSEATRSMQCYDGPLSKDNRYQMLGEHHTYLQCADQIDDLIKVLEEEEG